MLLMLSSRSSMSSLLESLSLSDSEPLDSDPLLLSYDELLVESSSDLLETDARFALSRFAIAFPPIVLRGDGVLIGLDGRAGSVPDFAGGVLLLLGGKSKGLMGCDAIWIFRRFGTCCSGVAFLLLLVVVVIVSSSDSESLPNTSNISFSRSFSKSSMLFRRADVGSDATEAADEVDVADANVGAGDDSIDAGNDNDVWFLLLRFRVMLRCINGRSNVNL